MTIPPKIHLDLPARIGLAFATAFEVRLVEQTTASWEFWLGLLEAFVNREGHLRVPGGYLVGNFQTRGVVQQPTRRT